MIRARFFCVLLCERCHYTTSIYGPQIPGSNRRMLQAALVLLYWLGAVFLLGGISLAIGGGRWFIRYLVSYSRRGGSGRIR